MTPRAPDRPLEAVVFDLDGTLVDSAPGLHMAAGAMLADLGLPCPDLATVISFIGQGAPKLVERCLLWARAAPGDHPEALATFLRHYEADPKAETTVYPGARELLEALRARGLRLGLCTNKPEAPTRAMLAALSLGPFDAVLGGDSLPVRKPDPAPLLRVIADLGTVPGAVLYVGDSETDWRTARAAGVAYVHVAGGYQTGPIADFAPWRRLDRLGDLAALI